jgi:transcriptional regulator with GAF, ATPase, and Fis domain
VEFEDGGGSSAFLKGGKPPQEADQCCYWNALNVSTSGILVIIDALRAASGRIAGKGGAAERLGLKRTTLQNKIRRLGIAKPHYQN